MTEKSFSHYAAAPIIGSLLAFSPPGDTAAQQISAATYDTNGDQQICRGPEADAFARYVGVVVSGLGLFARFDKNKDGVHSPAENHAYQDALRTATERAAIDFDDVLGSRNCIPVNELQTEFFGQRAKPFKLGNLMLRARHEAITILEPGTPLSRDQGALFSFTRDFSDKNDIWTARGAVMMPFLFEFPPENAADGCRPDNMRISNLSVTPSVAFDRVTNRRNKAAEVDSLAFRLGSQVELCGGGLFDTQYFTTWGTYNTDFGFDSEVVAVEFEYQPTAHLLGLGAANFIFDGAVAYRWSVVGHVEYGEVIKTGAKANLVKGNDFFRAGPELGLDIWFREGIAEGLHAYAEWSYLEGLTNTTRNSELFTAGFEYPMDSLGQFTVSTEYRYGYTPLVRDKTNQITFGIRIKI